MKLIIDISEKIYDTIMADEMPTREQMSVIATRIYQGKLYEERPHGEWINKDYGIGKCWATCSECGESTNGEAQDHGFGYDYSFPKFCPNCGADMREGDPDDRA